MPDFTVTIADADVDAFTAALDQVKGTSPVLAAVDTQIADQVAASKPPPPPLAPKFLGAFTETTEKGEPQASAVQLAGDVVDLFAGKVALILFDGETNPTSLPVISAIYDTQADFTTIRFAVNAFAGKTVDSIALPAPVKPGGKPLPPILESDAPGLIASALNVIKSAFASVVSFFTGN